ncbi:hypothetical protein ABZ832_07305 [Streptantibioticus parmotrematis]|uniref:hypothetical protein n=1 Tax=Streptantibioticus parmotrematis TaxID=2873249 RepID=UPI0033FE6793
MSRSHAVPTARVLRLAEDRGFGRPVTSVTVRPFTVPEVVGGCLAVLLAVPGLALSLPVPWPAAAHSVGYGLLSAVPLVVLVAWWCGRRAERPFAPELHCYHEGLILVTEDDVEAFAWHEVLVHDWTTTSRSNQQFTTRHVRLTTREGREIRHLTHPRETDAVSRLADAAEAPRAREQLESTGSVAFGDHLLSTAGLTTDGTFHPWSHLRRSLSPFRAQPRALEIRTGNRWQPLSVDGSTTPYRTVLLDLVGRCVDAAAPSDR